MRTGTADATHASDITDRAPKLERDLGWLDATMIVVGSMIGSGIFITSAESARLVGAPGWLLVAWALAGCQAECRPPLPPPGRGRRRFVSTTGTTSGAAYLR